MSDTAELLFANQAFYDVFRLRDLEGMSSLWAEGQCVGCVHPGWRALTTRAEVIESWRDILANPGSPRISCREAQAFLRGGLGIVICYEVIENSVLAATNVFAREGGVWKLIHHQAGPSNLSPAALDTEPETGPVQ